MNKWQLFHASLAFLALGANALAQDKPEDIRIVLPKVDKDARTVTLPGAFWNERLADWLETALCGRPSDFLHETLLSVTTTRTLLEQALRDIGCRDGDAWVSGVQDFPRIRGDRLLVVLEFTRNNKTEKYALDELITFSRWGVPLGPYGFMFKGDPDRTRKPPATTPATQPDSAKILRDDPQMALVFKGIRSVSQSFADHPLAYVENRWEWDEIQRGRNRALLPQDVYDSNGKVPVTVTFKKVTEEELITESAKLWHEDAFKAYMLKYVDTARRLDTQKAQYLSALGVAGGDAAGGRALARIERDYAALDAAWASWAVEHLKPEAQDADEAKTIRQQARLWGEFMTLNKERTEQLAIAADAPGNPQAGAALVARSRALIAENKQSRDYWQIQRDKLESPNADDVWPKTVRLRLALLEARLHVGVAGVALGLAQQVAPPDEAKTAELQKALETALKSMVLADVRVSLVTVEYEISKRQGLTGMEAELADLKKQRDDLLAKIKELGG